VDEMMFLDVNARSHNKVINSALIQYFAETLSVPFSVGGGISTLAEAAHCMRSGAEKVVLGTSAFENPLLIQEISDHFGSQAVVIAIDVVSPSDLRITTHSGTQIQEVQASEYLKKVENLGAGEILLQVISQEGTLEGLRPEPLTELAKNTNLPIIVSGGIRDVSDLKLAVANGASAVSVGALFQFTEKTPQTLRLEAQDMGISVRKK